MGRSDVLFEVGSKVAERVLTLRGYEYFDNGLVVAGYTYWGLGLSVLTVDPEGNEREFFNGVGLKALPC